MGEIGLEELVINSENPNDSLLFIDRTQKDILIIKLLLKYFLGPGVKSMLTSTLTSCQRWLCASLFLRLVSHKFTDAIALIREKMTWYTEKATEIIRPQIIDILNKTLR